MQYSQITAFDKGVLLVNVLVISTVCKCRHRPYITKNHILWTTFNADCTGLSSDFNHLYVGLNGLHTC